MTILPCPKCKSEGYARTCTHGGNPWAGSLNECGHLHRYGYAKGDYFCTCLGCGERFNGEKRATCCFHCALEAYHQQHPTSDSDHIGESNKMVSKCPSVFRSLGSVGASEDRSPDRSRYGRCMTCRYEGINIQQHDCSGELPVKEGVRPEQESSSAEVARNDDNVAPSTHQPVGSCPECGSHDVEPCTFRKEVNGIHCQDCSVLTVFPEREAQQPVDLISLVNELIEELDYDCSNWPNILSEQFKTKWRATVRATERESGLAEQYRAALVDIANPLFPDAATGPHGGAWCIVRAKAALAATSDQLRKSPEEKP